MAEFPAMPLWTDAYLADTSHLTTTEHGAYLLLLMAMWRSPTQSLPADDRLLARYSRLTTGQWRRVKPQIMPFFRLADGAITQGRLTAEHEFVRRRSRQQSDRAKARWLKTNDPPDAAASPEPCRDDAPTPTPIKKETPVGVSKESPPPAVEPPGGGSEMRETTREDPARRLPESWQLPVSWATWAMDVEGLDEFSVRREAERFKDYWLGVAGAKGRKKDWKATWRNWIRAETDRRRAKEDRHGKQTARNRPDVHAAIRIAAERATR